ncbi:hypothetical protein EGW08_010847 [Elysia chlorotica]|uniref:Uncharacterized protein n=1 Tax=Elysia chlorotica TaxID=188477 RepID=A0A3S1HKK3_ELYCH|nr:hypothetical protein EGW08_010847 [Elysia chlorotica]
MAVRVNDRLWTALLYLSLVYLNVVLCRNFDARFSVIKRGKHDDIYFGFSVAEHQYLDDFNGLQNVMLIGAPKEQRTIDGKFVGGSVYKCMLSESTSDCELLEALDPPAFRSTELVEDQWLGVTVASAGTNKKAVACAHRFIKDNAAMGSCNVLEPDLQYSASWFVSCSKFPHKNYMKDFGLCQQGMSAALGQDDALVMGAPGSVFWSGSVFMVNITDVPGASSTEKISPYKEPLGVKPGEQAAPTQAYTYNGYAVAMGRFDASKKMYYVSGAPKSGKGTIVFFTATAGDTLRYEEPHVIEGTRDFAGFGSSMIAVDLNNDGYDDLIVGAPYYYKRNHGGAIYVYLGGPKMITADSPFTEIVSRDMGEEECLVLQCEHARFGMSLTGLGDINKDGFNDFAVGAPYEGKGAVYIYHGSNAKEGFNTKYVQRITAEDLPVKDLRSFGYSLSGGMDLDKSSYPDLLVGAYESDAVALVRTRPMVKLQPGISVTPTSVDLDSKDGCELKVPEKDKARLCIQIKLCLNYTSSIPVTPEVVYKLEAEPQRRFARVELVGAKDDNKKFIEDKTMVLDENSEVCSTEIALLNSKFEDKLNPIEFRFSFALSSDSQNPQPYPESSMQDINKFPFLDTDGADPSVTNSKTAPVQFVMECGDDNECFSNLQFTAELVNLTRNDGKYELIIGTKNVLQIKMSVSNEDEPAYLTKVYIQAPDKVEYLGTDTQDGVVCQRLPEEEGTMLVCDQIGNPLREGKFLVFTVKLNVPRYFAENPDLNHNITVWVNTSSTEQTPLSDTHVLDFRVINKAELALGTNVAPDSAILCQGEPRGASAMKDETSIGAAVTHNFIVNNNGPGVVSESYITIQWPYEVPGPNGQPGKHLLYLMRMPKITGSVIKCNDDDIRRFVNPLGIKEVRSPEAATGASTDTAVLINNPAYTVAQGGETKSQPAKEAAALRQKREAVRSKRASSKVVTMSCHDDTARCFEYKCKLGKLEDKNEFVKISMEARLWESTLLSDYRKSDNVEIISWGHITVPEKLKIVQDTSDDSKRAITRAVPDFLESSGGKIKWWIILVAVLVGLIVLLVLIFILYKLGFFRRKRMEDMQMYKAEKKQQAMLQEYNDGV